MIRHPLTRFLVLAGLVYAVMAGYFVFRAHRQYEARRIDAYAEFARLKMSLATPLMADAPRLLDIRPQFTAAEAMLICDDYLQYWPDDLEANQIRSELIKGKKVLAIESP